MTAASKLTEVHRLSQVRLGAELVQKMLATFPILDPVDVDGTATKWLQVVSPIVQAQRAQSTRLAAAYASAFRSLHVGPDGEFVATLAKRADPARLTTSLMVTGPIKIKSLTSRAVALDRAVDIAGSSVARAAMRHALDGGRDTIQLTVANDDAALGWSRVTSGDPCAFCAMLASRGPDYRTEDTAGFEAHDGCSCGAEPIYSSDQPWAPGAESYRSLWDDVTRGFSGDDAINAFRQAFSAA